MSWQALINIASVREMEREEQEGEEEGGRTERRWISYSKRGPSNRCQRAAAVFADTMRSRRGITEHLALNLMTAKERRYVYLWQLPGLGDLCMKLLHRLLLLLLLGERLLQCRRHAATCYRRRGIAICQRMWCSSHCCYAAWHPCHRVQTPCWYSLPHGSSSSTCTRHTSCPCRQGWRACNCL